MKKNLLFVVPVSFLLLFFPNSRFQNCFAQQTSKENGTIVSPADTKILPENLKYSDEDKFQMVKAILEQTHEIKSRSSLPEFGLENLIIKLSDKNIAGILLPKFPKIEFVLLTGDYIKNYAGKQLDYWEFEYFKPEKYKVTVYFSIVMAGKGFFSSKYQTTFECRNENEKWVCRAVALANYN